MFKYTNCVQTIFMPLLLLDCYLLLIYLRLSMKDRRMHREPGFLKQQLVVVRRSGPAERGHPERRRAQGSQGSQARAGGGVGAARCGEVFVASLRNPEFAGQGLCVDFWLFTVKIHYSYVCLRGERKCVNICACGLMQELLY